MPCTALARGIRQTPPHTSLLPFNDAINNSPCGKPAVTSVAGVSVVAESLCPNHWVMKHGYLDWVGPFVVEGGGAPVQVKFGEQNPGPVSNTVAFGPGVVTCAQQGAVLAAAISRLDHISVRINVAAPVSLRGCVYAGAYGALLAYGPATAIPAMDGWADLPLNGAALAVGSYTLGVESLSGSINCFVFCFADSVTPMRYGGAAPPTPPATPCPAGSSLNYRMSVYAVGDG